VVGSCGHVTKLAEFHKIWTLLDYLSDYWFIWEGLATFVLVNEPLKGKAIPLQAWTGPEGSRRLRVPDFKTIGT
jgi:hypothetical protein